MWRLPDQRPNLDAVFVASDIMAAGALHALRRAGRRVPDDVAVIGFDDLPLAQHTQPPLHTRAPPRAGPRHPAPPPPPPAAPTPPPPAAGARRRRRRGTAPRRARRRRPR